MNADPQQLVFSDQLLKLSPEPPLPRNVHHGAYDFDLRGLDIHRTSHDMEMLHGLVGEQQAASQVEILALIGRSTKVLLYMRPVLGMNPLKHCLHRRLGGSIVFKDPKGLFRPGHLRRRDSTAETPGAAQALCFGEVRFVSAKSLIGAAAPVWVGHEGSLGPPPVTDVDQRHVATGGAADVGYPPKAFFVKISKLLEHVLIGLRCFGLTTNPACAPSPCNRRSIASFESTNGSARFSDEISPMVGCWTIALQS